MNKSIYIHIPFCKSICSYCDFCKTIYNEENALRYLIALEKEIIDNYNKETIKTIYIGGGTPSALSIPLLKKLFNIIETINLDSEYEFTFEMNIDDIREELLTVLKENKVNRLSIGVESFNKSNLKFLERDADFKDVMYKINLCRKHGFKNINVDLMYALPNESFRVLKKDVKKLLKLNVEHISTYSLIIEENTKLKINKEEYISDRLDRKMYNYIIKKLKINSYNHYEISNFSKPGYESIHNLTYWNNEEYYGFGLGASGYYELVRYENTKNLSKYLENDIKKNIEVLSNKEIMDYELMLGLRKTKGVSLSEFKNKYNLTLEEVFNIEKELKDKNLIIENDYIFINPKKIYVMNNILVNILNLD